MPFYYRPDFRNPRRPLPLAPFWYMPLSPYHPVPFEPCDPCHMYPSMFMPWWDIPEYEDCPPIPISPDPVLDDSVDSSKIKDGSVEMVDLSEELQNAINNAGADGNTTYTLSISDDTISLNGSDESESNIQIPPSAPEATSEDIRSIIE